MVKNLEGEELEDFLQKKDVFILDVRTPLEFGQGALEGATLIPVDELGRRIDELPKDKSQPILIYCAHGVRSVHAQTILENHGYQNTRNMRGGLAAFIHYLRNKNG